VRGLGRLQRRIDRLVAQLQRQGLAIAALVAVGIARGDPPEVVTRRQWLRQAQVGAGAGLFLQWLPKLESAAICSTLLRAPGAWLQRKRGRSLLIVCPCSGARSAAAEAGR
jgi:hypothetical protein